MEISQEQLDKLLQDAIEKTLFARTMKRDYQKDILQILENNEPNDVSTRQLKSLARMSPNYLYESLHALVDKGLIKKQKRNYVNYYRRII